MSNNNEWPIWDHGGVIWIIEDDANERRGLCSSMTKSGFKVREFTGIKAFQAALERDDAPDAVIADIRLDDGDFFTIFDDYAPLKIPTVILSNKVLPMYFDQIEPYDGIVSLLEKPATPIILATRIIGMVKRSHHAKGRASIMTLDTNHHTVYNKCGKAELTKIDMKILACLDQTAHYIVSMKDIMQKVWPDDRVCDEAKVRVNVTRLNKKIATLGLKVIYDRQTESYTLGCVDDGDDGASSSESASA